ncbi:Sodium-dependent serotonin transporter [Amphibalanus amphitrite]|uniref:Transporter n=1 Tax=Amphibalanus amphitrite TaxID=1232801 RepID=A0A6A4WEN7_AMPAM|nr:Sodium-dependent serotonin transporter [Amphibalanus amphitrite]
MSNSEEAAPPARLSAAGVDLEPSARLKEAEAGAERETWDKKVEFLLAVIGFAVDLGNVWRFPYICYKNGGGAFLIPYLIMLIFGGLPLFYMELALGQYHRSGCLTLWKKICPALKGIGYAICIIDIYMAMCYNTVLAWSVYYLVQSLQAELPWTRCFNAWNTDRCRQSPANGTLPAAGGGASNSSANTTSPAYEFFHYAVLEVQHAKGIDDLGAVKWPLALSLLAVFFLVYFSLWKGVKSTGKVVWITALFPYVVLFILFLRGITLPGAWMGIRYYLTPQWHRLSDVKVWIDAATQIFFSLGPGFGTLLALSSYNKFNNNCFKDAMITSTINCLTSFLAGFVIFSVLGYMATVQHKDINEVGTDGPGLVFYVYPEAVAMMSGSVFWAIIFFLMLITLGLDSTFGGLEAMITGLCDEYPNMLGKHREIFVGFLLVFCYICAIPTTTYGGTYVVDLLMIYGPGISVLFIVFVESVAVCWFYGANRFAGDVERMLGSRPGIFWRICWNFVSPLFLLFIFVCSLVTYEDLRTKDYIYPRWSILLGWAMTGSSLACIPAYIIYMFLATPGSLKQRFYVCITPESDLELNSTLVPAAITSKESESAAAPTAV